MIRRDIAPAGAAASWMLIPQVEHAALAAELAQHWHRLDDGIQQPRDLVVSTIRRHDDGWSSRDAFARVDPSSGVPLDFMEQPVEISNEIWSRSIESLEDLGPLAQLMVAEHFLKLRGGGDSAKTPAGLRFIRQYRARCTGWRRQTTQSLGLSGTEQDAAINQLSFFDAVSLWLCCRADATPWTLSTWGHTALTLSPRSPDRQSLPGIVTVAPWPFRSPELVVQVHGRVVAARHYTSPEDLQASLGPRQPLMWRLLPAA
jgi:hypothetical protein